MIDLAPTEVHPVQSAMRDVQVSIRDYHRVTGRLTADPAAYTTPIRACVSFIQKVHDVFQNEITESDDYKREFAARLEGGDKGSETIEGFRYVRNVGQHLLHPVTPKQGRIVGNNMGLGFRASTFWAEVPQQVHARLRPGTQSLRPYYCEHLEGRPTLDVLLDACQFFGDLCPSAVSRDQTGEWTAFPLRIQPGTNERVHPEEPTYDDQRSDDSAGEVRKWLNERKPGGVCRWIVRVGDDPDAALGRTVQGFTFSGDAGGATAFVPFVESETQVLRDVLQGYPYFEGGREGNIYFADAFFDRTGAQFQTIVCKQSFVDWATPVTDAIRTRKEANHFPEVGEEDWLYYESIQSNLSTRRTQRMNAWYPIWT